MTRRQIGFVLDSFLLFLVALFIYRLGRRSGKKYADETRLYVTGSSLYPDGGMLLRADGRDIISGQFPRIMGEGFDFTYKTDESESTWNERLNENVLRKGTFNKSITTGLRGVTSMSGGGRHVPGRDLTWSPRENAIVGLDKLRREIEDEDNYYDERE